MLPGYFLATLEPSVHSLDREGSCDPLAHLVQKVLHFHIHWLPVQVKLLLVLHDRLENLLLGHFHLDQVSVRLSQIEGTFVGHHVPLSIQTALADIGLVNFCVHYPCDSIRHIV